MQAVECGCAIGPVSARGGGTCIVGACWQCVDLSQRESASQGKGGGAGKAVARAEENHGDGQAANDHGAKNQRHADEEIAVDDPHEREVVEERSGGGTCLRAVEPQITK